MPLRNPPTGWVHTWLKPFYDWLLELVAAVNGSGGAVWDPVRVLTAGALAANTYSAVTQTKTANANGTLTVDGVLLAVGDRLWDKNAATGSQRGLFVVTDAGAAGGGGRPWKVKRADDAKASGDFVDGKVFAVGEGTQAGQSWMFTNNAPFVLDTDTPAIAQVQSGAAGGDLTGTYPNPTIGGNKVTGTALSAGAQRLLAFAGHNNVGACVATGAKVGDTVVGIIDLAAATVSAAGSFEATITVADQIQQTDVADLSAKKYALLVVAKS